jgi:hypothetical protein
MVMYMYVKASGSAMSSTKKESDVDMQPPRKAFSKQSATEVK